MRPEERYVGPYALYRPIGQGGMGEVWEAEHVLERQRVALKLMKSELARSSSYQDAFRKEVHAVASLRHANIVQVFDHGVLRQPVQGVADEGAAWLAMELLEGASLSRYRLQLSFPQLAHVLLELLSALAHSHARGLVHRDLKLGNVMVVDGRSVLLDFGLAHSVEEGQVQGAIIGTATYMAPEQLAGRELDYGPWTDLYALGCMTWALCTGSTPFRLADVEARKHLGRPLPDFHSQHEVPPGLLDWLRRLLAQDHGERFQRAADAALALRELLGESGRRRVPETWPQQPERPAARLSLFGLRELPVVGRGREQKLLWEALRRGRGAVLVQGPAGSGKTHLVRWLTRLADELGLVEVFQVREGGLTEAVRRHLRVELGSFQSEGARHRAVLRELQRRERPVLVWLEDIHADADAVAFGMLAAKELLVLATSRELPADRAPAVDALMELPGARRIELGPLPPGFRPRLVQEVLGLEPQLAAQVEAQTGAMPLFVVELVGEWVRSGLLVAGEGGYRLRPGAALPADLHDVWIRRVERALHGCGELERKALFVAAVMGLRVERERWSRAADGAGWWVSPRLVGRLLESGLMEADRSGQVLSWVHALLRDSLVRQARLEEQLDACHRACLPVSEAVELGRHLLALGRPEEALTPLLEGAWELVVHSEYLRAEQALALREHAVGELGLQDRRAVKGWIMQARVARRRKRAVRAAAWARRAAAAARWPDLHCQALRELVRVHRGAGELDEAVACAREAVTQAQLSEDVLALAWARRDLGELTSEEEVLRLALAAFEEADEAYGAGTAALHLGELDRARDHFRTALKRQEPAWSWVGLGDVAAREGDLSSARSHYDRAVRRFEEIGGPGLSEARERRAGLG